MNICVSECLHYQNLTSGNRKVSYKGSSPNLCDNALPDGWYRFQGDAGTKMPTSCVAPDKCSTRATGWLNGAHPSVEEGKVARKVCFNWNSKCCRWSINIEVLNCGGFFLYHFKGTPPENPCYLRYCSTDWGNQDFRIPINTSGQKNVFKCQSKVRIDNQVAFHTRGNYLLQNLVNLKEKLFNT